jgi:hypothetical protein
MYKAIVWTKHGDHVFGAVVNAELKSVVKPVD